MSDIYSPKVFGLMGGFPTQVVKVLAFHQREISEHVLWENTLLCRETLTPLREGGGGACLSHQIWGGHSVLESESALTRAESKGELIGCPRMRGAGEGVGSVARPALQGLLWEEGGQVRVFHGKCAT